VMGRLSIHRVSATKGDSSADGSRNKEKKESHYELCGFHD